jgi:hypothetical protein
MDSILMKEQRRQIAPMGKWALRVGVLCVNRCGFATRILYWPEKDVKKSRAKANIYCKLGHPFTSATHPHPNNIQP